MSTSTILNDTKGKEHLWWTPEHQCTSWAGKDLNSPELETDPSIQKLYNGYYSQRESADKQGSNSVRLRSWIYVLTVQILEDAPAVLFAWTYSDRRSWDIPMSGPGGQNLPYFQTRQKIQCNTENYVQTVVLRISTGLPSSTTSTSSNIGTGGLNNR